MPSEFLYLKRFENIVDVVLPLALPKTMSYKVADSQVDQLLFGIRVEVSLRNKLYSGIVVSEVYSKEIDYPIKPIVSILDESPIVTKKQFALWKWISSYYCCTLGEIMSVSLPGNLKLYSETKITGVDDYDDHIAEMSDDEYMIMEAVSIQGELSIFNVQEILNKKSVYPSIHKLIDKRLLFVKEELVEKFKPKKHSFIKFPEELADDQEWLTSVFDKVERSDHQRRALLAFIQHKNKKNEALKSQVVKTAIVTSSVISAMMKKGIFIEEKREVSRLNAQEMDLEILSPLSPLQKSKLLEIRTSFEEKRTVLLHGVTGSGKTRLYIEFINEILEKGGQVLYLLPEIALTTQIVARLRKVFGDKILVYHSKLNAHERVELYKASREGGKLILGARSAIFMPFSSLDFIIVDEEHDSSFKQQDPAPRYNARDTAIVLANIFDAKVLLGSATPSLESWINAHDNKYGFVSILERFGDSMLPEIQLVNLKDAYQKNKMKSYFSKDLLQAMCDEIVMGRQVILFQNRRGFAPVLQCEICAWKADCRNCDTSLTIHKYFNEVRCHYCGFRQNLPPACPSCGNEHLREAGFGTEKLELELKKLMPEVRIGRMDYDTAKTKNQYEKIIYEFSSHQLDILIGTQMVTKGLDFEKVSLVGILNADKLLAFPNFRATERAFQLMTQVSGRAGRRKKRGKVIIQTFTPTHTIFTDVINTDYSSFYEKEFDERKKAVFPPIIRAIEITIKHKKEHIAREAGQLYRELIYKEVGQRVSALFTPSIPRLRNYYIQKLFIKMEKDPKVNSTVKTWVQYYRLHLLNSKGFKSVRVNIDVDPY